MKLIDKDALVAEIERRIKTNKECMLGLRNLDYYQGKVDALNDTISFIDTLEVKEVDNFLTSFISFKDMVNIQYSSVNDGIKAHAETYSFNIESELFNQLTPEQQKLWRKEIEQACISGGEMGVELARDTRYKENLKVKEVDLEHEVESYWKQCDMTWCRDAYSMTHIRSMLSDIAKHFFELGMAVSNKAQKGE
jgi:hypothetical protein